MTARLSLSRAPDAFVPGATWARISCAEWTGDEPVIRESVDGPSALVVVWPGDMLGHVDKDRARMGRDVLVTKWIPSDYHIEALRDFVADGWRLVEHDLYVRNRTLTVAQGTLRDGPWWPAARVAGAIRRAG